MADRAARKLALEEVIRMFEDDDGEPQDDLSDDEEELLGDFVDGSGKQMLFSDIGGEGSDGEEYVPVQNSLDPCYRSSLLLLDGSLNEVHVHSLSVCIP